MKKIPTVFQRDMSTKPPTLTDVVTPGCEWVLAGEGVGTRKYDGTCVMFDGVAWWARREVKAGKAAPQGWVFVSFDEVTGKSMGWEPIEQSSFAKFHAEALIESELLGEMPLPASTYELIGPKINGNPEQVECHYLMRHATAQEYRLAYPVDFEGLRERFGVMRWEGVVWHHPDGRMAKLKVRDFGPAPTSTNGESQP